MNRAAHTACAAALTLVMANHAGAQVLGEPPPMNRVMEITQFGVPRDAKYILCDEQNCPDRTVKTFTAPTLPANAGAGQRTDLVRPPSSGTQQSHRPPEPLGAPARLIDVRQMDATQPAQEGKAAPPMTKPNTKPELPKATPTKPAKRHKTAIKPSPCACAQGARK